MTNSTTLPLYWDLASVDPQVRENAANSLITSLANFQNAHKMTVKDKWDDLLEWDDSEKRLDALSAPDVSYALRRLIRGLPSSRQGARQGFSLALTELLATMDFVTVKLVADLLFKFTARTPGMKGEEEREMLFGRIFGFMCIVDSGILKRSTTAEDDIRRIVDSLVEMAGAKSYLTECCYHVMMSMLPHVSAPFDGA
ncbi:hypothetical protein BC936DRAFT_138399 [Jimgerdemannia flammicorona]|uniref:Uncharacterized protein n=2 Tax=Jimgerdemannia flammicorona TaxID=994334 RepID=A0A433CIK2_9FUNG|nr:hypothetical protein BC936DRAFT_138399 [Jimgerdemannia flammicorona]RUS25673.1 hypothetical protein BC938DRAFT_471804 [Jimgerdemannia flammicorona]